MKLSSHTTERDPSYLVFLGFTIASIFMLVIVINTILAWYQVKWWKETPAYILKAELVVTTDYSGGNSYQATVYYRYTFNEKDYENTRISINPNISVNIGNFQQTIYEQIANYSGKDKPFRCYVNPENPAESVLYRKVDWNTLGSLMVFAIFFGSIGLTGFILNQKTFRIVTFYPSYLEIEHSSDSFSKRKRTIKLFSIIWNILSFPTWIMLYGALEEDYHSALWVATFPLVGLLLVMIALKK